MFIYIKQSTYYCGSKCQFLPKFHEYNFKRLKRDDVFVVVKRVQTRIKSWSRFFKVM